jgi:hypothetical protein
MAKERRKSLLPRELNDVMLPFDEVDFFITISSFMAPEVHKIYTAIEPHK